MSNSNNKETKLILVKSVVDSENGVKEIKRVIDMNDIVGMEEKINLFEEGRSFVRITF